VPGPSTKKWRPHTISTSSSASSAVVSPSTSISTNSSQGVDGLNGQSTSHFSIGDSESNDGIESVIGELNEAKPRQQVPYYKRPDQYNGLVEKIRESMKEQESQMQMARRVMDELNAKAKRLFPNGSLNGRLTPNCSIADLLTMVNINNSPSADGRSSPCSSLLGTGHWPPPCSPASTMSSADELPDKSLKDKTCEICHETFASVQSKMRHAKRKHADQLDKITTKYNETLLPFACHICHKSFATSAPLRIHERRHQEDQKRFHCPHCPKRYIMGSELKKHIKKSHSNQLEGRSSPTQSTSSIKPVTVEDMPDI